MTTPESNDVRVSNNDRKHRTLIDKAQWEGGDVMEWGHG
jgi:hypothetical protein